MTSQLSNIYDVTTNSLAVAVLFHAEHGELHVDVGAGVLRPDGVSAVRQVLVLRGEPR